MTFDDLMPRAARIERITPESADTRTYVLALTAGARRPDGGADPLECARPGQFVMLSLFGHGEAAFSLSALRCGGGVDAGTVVLTVRRVGRLTSALFALEPGDMVGLRGPFGRGFPDVFAEPTLYVAGGCGLSPLKPAIERHLAARGDGTPLAVLYGMRRPEDRIHRSALAALRRAPDTLVIECVEEAARSRDRAGTVLDFLAEAVAESGARRAMACGPDAMLHGVAEHLLRLGLEADHIHLALERQMKCGVGHCGHCYVDHLYVCKDGPVFSYAELRGLKDAFGPVRAHASC